MPKSEIVEAATMASAVWDHQSRLPMLTVIRPTNSDFPGMWVARLWFILPQPEHTNFVLIADTYEELEKQIPDNMTKLMRNDADDPVIEETWL